MDKEDKIPTVLRISVDERLSEDLIRLEICELIRFGESKEFKDEPDFWSDIIQGGEEIVARLINPGKVIIKGPNTDMVSILESLVEQFPWKDLKEGQVFLSGAFEVKEEQRRDKKVKRYFIRSGEKAIKQIDDDVKENTKTLYYEILAKGGKNGKL